MCKKSFLPIILAFGTPFIAKIGEICYFIINEIIIKNNKNLQFEVA